MIDKSFLKQPRRYVVQCLLAVLTVGIILYFTEALTQTVMVASLGSSAFVVFAMPQSTIAQPRRLIGGHAVGLFSGIICHYAFLAGPLSSLVNRWEVATLTVYALAIGISIFLMVITDTEHPPAAGTALGIVSQPWSLRVILFVLLFAAGLAIARRLLKGNLKNLV